MNKAEFSRTAKVPFEKRYGNFIGGKWAEPRSGKYFENRSPVNGQFLCPRLPVRTSRMSKQHSTLRMPRRRAGGVPALRNARSFSTRSQTGWRRISDRLAVAETWDGKPIRETTAADLPLAIDHFRYFAGAIRAQEGSISEIDHDTVAYHFHEPLGVVGQIIPWNFPLLMACWKLAPAIAAGNCVVLKPAEQTPSLHPGLGRSDC